MNRTALLSTTCIALALAAGGAATARGQTTEWIRQLGSTQDNATSSYLESSRSVAADGMGSVYMVGYAAGRLPQGVATDRGSVYVAKYDEAGVLEWTRRLSGFGGADASNVSADRLGNIFVTGSYGSSLTVPVDAFLARFDSAGNLHWARPFGPGEFAVWGHEASADGLGNVYVAGTAQGAFAGPHAGLFDFYLAKYDPSGDLLWARQLGSSGNDTNAAVSADGLGNVYLAGTTQGALGGPNAGGSDAFLAKYDAEGNLQWTRQLGGIGQEDSIRVAADRLGNVFLSGSTSGNVATANAGATDMFLAKYDDAGNRHWTRQFGASGADVNFGIAADGLGGAFISGNTRSSLASANLGGADAFLARYDGAGRFQWSRQFGTSANEAGGAVAADGRGNVYLAGSTSGSFDSATAGHFQIADAFLAKIHDPTAVVGLPGDFNRDGVVDGGDVLAWQRGLGSDFTADDLSIWKANYGATAFGAAAVPVQSPVPEPASASLLGILGAAGLCAGRTRRGIASRRSQADAADARAGQAERC